MRVLLIIFCFLFLSSSSSSHAFSTSSITNWLSEFIDFLPLPIIADSVSSNNQKPPPPPKSPDYHKLALQWPPALRLLKKYQFMPPTINFTIHGLWPAYNSGGQDPAGCKQAPKFDKAEVLNIEKQLNDSWPNLASEDNAAFWELEWNKHGTCSGLTVADYFKFSLLRKYDYDPLQILKDAGILPDQTKHYTETTLETALNTKTQLNVRIRCDKHGSDWYLKEVVFCVELSGLAFEKCGSQFISSCRKRFLFLPW